MRGHGPVGRWLFAAILVVICGVAGIASIRPLVRAAVTALIEQAGVPVRSLELRTLGVRHAEFGSIELGEAGGPSAASARASWSLAELAQGRIDRLALRGAKVSISFDGDAIAVAGLPGWAAQPRSGAAPVQRIDVLDGRLTANTPAGRIVASLDATLTNASGGLQLESVTIHRAELPFAGGSLSVAKATYRRGRPFAAALEVGGVGLEALLKLLDVDGLSGSGILNGRIPLRVDNSGFRISDGSVAAAGRGVLRYTGGALAADAAGGDQAAADRLKLVRDALADFRYDSLKLALERAPSGEGSLTAKLAGANPAVLDGHPFDINVRFETNFDKLAGVLMEGYAAAARLLRAQPAR